MSTVYLNRFRAEGRYLGAGGQSVVLAGEDLQTSQRVAIRLCVSASGSAAHRMQRAASIDVVHPNVLRTLAGGISNGQPCHVTEYIPGPTLKQHIQERGRLRCSEALWIVAGVLRGLGALHQAGVIHRDIKPANIILGPDGPVIIDLGLARLVGRDTLTASGDTVGTLDFMAPEQIATPDRVGFEADVFSLGVSCFNMVTGELPWTSADADELVALKLRQDAPRPSSVVPGVSEEVDALCERLLSRDPRKRGVAPPKSGSLRCLACGKSLGSAPTRCPGCDLPFPPTRPRLEFTDGPAAGQVFLIPQAEFVTGRLQIAPESLNMSRRQMHVACSGSVMVRDLGAANPTRLDDGPLTFDAFLRPGDRLHVAGSTGRFLVGA